MSWLWSKTRDPILNRLSLSSRKSRMHFKKCFPGLIFFFSFWITKESFTSQECLSFDENRRQINIYLLFTHLTIKKHLCRRRRRRRHSCLSDKRCERLPLTQTVQRRRNNNFDRIICDDQKYPWQSFLASASSSSSLDSKKEKKKEEDKKNDTHNLY